MPPPVWPLASPESIPAQSLAANKQPGNTGFASSPVLKAGGESAHSQTSQYAAGGSGELPAGAQGRNRKSSAPRVAQLRVRRRRRHCFPVPPTSSPSASHISSEAVACGVGIPSRRISVPVRVKVKHGRMSSHSQAFALARHVHSLAMHVPCASPAKSLQTLLVGVPNTIGTAIRSSLLSRPF